MLEERLLGVAAEPERLKKLTHEQLRLLCRELRQKIIATVSKNGGHLASNLGVVELTVALHRVFELPEDQLVWDVGHQAYAHKLLSGRLEQFGGLRREDGISGFPRPSESCCDGFIAGHASTSLSAACGLAKANTLAGRPRHVVAIAGDGAMTGGMLYEALNNAGRSGDRLIFVLNNNEMSISKSVGSFARYLAEKRASKGYLELKNYVEEILCKIPGVGRPMRDALVSSKAALRQMLYHSNLFEDLGFEYFGPVDGHDLQELTKVLAHAKSRNRPVVVHVETVKGKGYPFAERDPAKFHGVGGFEIASGRVPPASENFSAVFGAELCRLARADRAICAITAAMEGGTGLSGFAEEFGKENRFFDVGIAEEHAVTFACGMAAGGMKPVFAVYSTFLQRGYDQLIHDSAIEPQPIVLAVDRAGIVGDDGETHQGLFDAAYLSSVPGMRVYSPADFDQLRYALGQAVACNEGPSAVRYPRGGEPKLPFTLSGDYTRHGEHGEVLVVSYGRQIAQVVQARELLGTKRSAVDLLCLCRIVPIPEECVRMARRYRGVLFVEEGVLHGGIGEHFLAALAHAGYRGKADILAVEHPFLPQMTVQAALVRCGLDAASLAERLRALYF